MLIQESDSAHFLTIVTDNHLENYEEVFETLKSALLKDAGVQVPELHDEHPLSEWLLLRRYEREIETYYKERVVDQKLHSAATDAAYHTIIDPLRERMQELHAQNIELAQSGLDREERVFENRLLDFLSVHYPVLEKHSREELLSMMEVMRKSGNQLVGLYAVGTDMPLHEQFDALVRETFSIAEDIMNNQQLYKEHFGDKSPEEIMHAMSEEVVKREKIKMSEDSVQLIRSLAQLAVHVTGDAVYQ